MESARSLISAIPADRVRAWLTAGLLAVVAGIVRFWDLGRPTDNGTPIFDEKHYAPQAWQMLRNGGYEDNPGYELVVHPPVGKQLIAIGEWLLGYNPWGWRVASALAGTLMVLMIVRIGRRLTGSTLLGGIAGILLISDGLSHVQSRVAMLDIFQAMFLLAAFGCLLVDRDQVRAWLAAAVAQRRIGDTACGPRLGFRWWRLAAGVALGLACGVKWSGVYYIAAFGLLSVVWDALARRAAGAPRPWWGTLRRDAGPAVWSLAAIPMLVYAITWAGWFASETATDRNAAIARSDIGFGFLPNPIRSLLYYQLRVLEFHTSLTTPENNPHPWESKPWAWPMGYRPVLYYFETGRFDCRAVNCVEATMLVGTPAIWWLALPVAGWAIWRAVTGMDWRYGAVLVAYGAGYLPWFSNLDRQMYYFYATPLAPFLVLGLVLVLGEVLGSARDHAERRKTGLMAVSLYIGIVVTNFAWLWPILNGEPISVDRWQAELWLPSWR